MTSLTHLTIEDTTLNHLTIESVPQDSLHLFKTLYHWTRADLALEILESANIFGTDNGRHANFFINEHRKNIERYSELCLTFRFEGNHAFLFGDTFSYIEAPPNSHNTIFHLITSNPSVYDTTDSSTLANLEHWQTNAYPNVKGLVFTGIHQWLCPFLNAMNTQTPPKEPRKLFNLNYKRDLRIHRNRKQGYELKKRILAAAQSQIGQPFSVLPPR